MMMATKDEIKQRELRLRRQVRPVLVDMNRAIEATGYAPEAVLEMVDLGELRWVWDVSLPRSTQRNGATHRRELRFWLGELLMPGERANLGLLLVIDMIIGREAVEDLRAVTVGDILMIRRQQVQRLVRTGELRGRRDGHPCWVTRNSLVEFLSKRWVGR